MKEQNSEIIDNIIDRTKERREYTDRKKKSNHRNLGKGQTATVLCTMKMACNSNVRMHGTAYSISNHSVSAQNDSSYCNMSSGCSKKVNQQIGSSDGGGGGGNSHNSNNNNNNSSSKYVTESKQNSNQLISSNKCQKPMLNTVLRLTHNCRYVNAAAILLITLNILATLSPCDAFLLDGSQNSFAQFRKWYTGLNGSLEFEFKTEQPNGLVLYEGEPHPLS